MLEWINSVIASFAYDAAVQSVDLASFNGLYQLEEPEALKKLANEEK